MAGATGVRGQDVERENVGLKCHLLPGWLPWNRVRWDQPWVFYWAPAVCQASEWKLGHDCVLSTLHVTERHTQGPISAGSPCGLTTARFTEETAEAQTDKVTAPRPLSPDAASRKEMLVIDPVVLVHTDCTCQVPAVLAGLIPPRASEVGTLILILPQEAHAGEVTCPRSHRGRAALEAHRSQPVRDLTHTLADGKPPRRRDSGEPRGLSVCPAFP